MVGRKVTVVAAVLAIFVSGIAGSTALHSRSASAGLVDDPYGTVRQGISDGRDALVDTTRQVATDAATTVVYGLGEMLILVIADQVSSADAAAKLAAVNDELGNLQGYYVDASDNYVLSGVYVQDSADATEVTCDPADCPDGPSTVEQLTPVHLRLLTLDQFSYSSFPANCGGTGLPPCQQDRYRQVLGDQPSISPGHSLIVSAFRTRVGAEQFIEFSRNSGVSGLVTVQARKLGGGDIGLGQEPHPDGSGPLTAPLPDQDAQQH